MLLRRLVAFWLFAAIALHSYPLPLHAGEISGRSPDPVAEPLNRLVARHQAPDSAGLEQARAAVRQDLAELQAQLDAVPNGAILARDWRLALLATELHAAHPRLDALRSLEIHLRRTAPRTLRPLVNRLRDHVGDWQMREMLVQQSDIGARLAGASERLTRFWQARDVHGAPDDFPADVRASYELLARLARASAADAEELAPLRAALSFPNEVLCVGGDYLQHVARREFELPVNVREQAQSTSITARGRIPSHTELELVPNNNRAEMRVKVLGAGSLQLAARSQRAELTACGHPVLHASQVLYVDARGVDGERPEISLATRLRLQQASLRPRRPLLEHCLASLVARRAARQLAAGEPELERGAEQQMEARVAEEGSEIAYRIQGMFQRFYWEGLGALQVEPRLTMRSSARAVEGFVEHGRHWQLAAPGTPPRLPEPAADIELALHQSALNNVADALAGLIVDEASMRDVLLGKLRLTAGEERFGFGRRATSLGLADDEPLQVRLGQQTVMLLLRVQRCSYEGILREFSPKQVQVTYRVEFAAPSVQATRIELQLAGDGDGDGDANTAAVRAVLERFFPAELRSAPRFPNANFPDPLCLSHLRLDHGWLTIGVARASLLSAER